MPWAFRTVARVPNWIEGYLLELNGMLTRATGIRPLSIAMGAPKARIKLRLHPPEIFRQGAITTALERPASAGTSRAGRQRDAHERPASPPWPTALARAPGSNSRRPVSQGSSASPEGAGTEGSGFEKSPATSPGPYARRW